MCFPWDKTFFCNKVKVISQHKGQISRSHFQKMAFTGALLFQEHSLTMYLIWKQYGKDLIFIYLSWEIVWPYQLTSWWWKMNWKNVGEDQRSNPQMTLSKLQCWIHRMCAIYPCLLLFIVHCLCAPQDYSKSTTNTSFNDPEEIVV